MSFFSMLHVPPHTLERVDLGGKQHQSCGFDSKEACILTKYK